MPVRKTRGRWHVDINFQGVRYRPRCPENTKASAQAYEAVLRRRLARGESIDNLKDTAREKESSKIFKEAAWQWYKTYVKTNTKPSVQRSYEMTLRVHLVPQFGSRKLDTLTSLDIEEYKAEKLRKGLAPKSVNNHLAILSKLLKDCKSWLWMKSVPQITWLKVPPQPYDFLTHQETRRLLDMNRESSWHDMILCAVRTGMRRGELKALRWKDIDLKRRKITVRRSLVCGVESSPKNNRVRHIPILDDLFGVMTSRSQTSEYVFPGENGGPLLEHKCTQGLHAACRSAGLRLIGWHTLRHTFASQLAAESVPIPAIQTLLGHSTIEMTMRYSHLSSSTLQTTISALLKGEQREMNEIGAILSPRIASTVKQSA